MTSSAPLRCKCRRQAVTGLRCSRCFVPICPDCSIPAPVGMLCRDCARGKPSHLYQVDPKILAMAAPITLIVAIFGGWLISSIRGIGFFGLFAGFIYGIGIGELALRLTGRKRGLKIEILAGACAFLGLLGGRVLGIATVSLMAAGHPGPMAVGSPETDQNLWMFMVLLDPWLYLTIGVSMFGAVSRVRSIG